MSSYNDGCDCDYTSYADSLRLSHNEWHAKQERDYQNTYEGNKDFLCWRCSKNYAKQGRYDNNDSRRGMRIKYCEKCHDGEEKGRK